MSELTDAGDGEAIVLLAERAATTAMRIILAVTVTVTVTVTVPIVGGALDGEKTVATPVQMFQTIVLMPMAPRETQGRCVPSRTAARVL